MPILETDADIDAILPTLRTIAVLGIKPGGWDAPAYFVPAFAIRAGLDVIPVPVYYPEATEILGRPVVRRLADIGRPIDAVIVFRRPDDIPAHVDDILAAKPRAVWMQLGIRHAEVAERLSSAGIAVVQDRCLMTEMEDRAFPGP